MKLLTKIIIPFKIVLQSIPIFNKLRLNLSNFSGVSLLSMLKEKGKDELSLGIK